MPKQEEQKKKITPAVKPTESWLSRFFGSELTPEMKQAIEIVKKENPNLAPVETYGPISRLLMSKANAYTSPTGNIYLNPTQLQGYSPQDIADTLTHEQTHVNQIKDRNLNPILETFRGLTEESYHRRPDEMEAFKVEMLRRTNQGRGQTAIPSFLTGEHYTPSDIKLRAPSDEITPEQRLERLYKLYREPRLKK